MPDNEYPPSWNTRPQQAEEAPARDYPAAWTRPEDRVSPSTSDPITSASGDAQVADQDDERGQQQLNALYRAVGKPELADPSAHPFQL
jgi:hypothetical protein